MSDALVRRALFLWGPEEAHGVALAALALAQERPWLRAALRGAWGPGATRPVDLWGLRFPSAVGLAAGWDKDARAWKALAALGFGHVEVGTVTPQPQPGNPKPRVFRLEAQESLINRMGFPSDGADVVRARLDTERPYGVVLGVNLGKNKDTPLEEAGRDYEAGVERFVDVADYLVVNVSSPNTPGLRKLQTGAALRGLLEGVVARRTALRPGVPVLVKLAPDLDDADLRDAAEAAGSAGVDGIIATNTTLSRDGANGPAASEAGGLSGALLTERALAVLVALRGVVGDRLPLVAAGGIMTPEHAQARLDAGASLVQLYTGFVYGGPGAVRRVAEGAAHRR